MLVADPLAGRRKGNHFAAWQEPNFVTTEAEPYSGHCADRRPTNKRRSS